MNLDKLLDRLANLRREAEALAGEVDGFPALACNMARLLAGLRVMEIDLGLVGPGTANND
ncbi:MAG: hypothetical protein HY788_03155 [Deltaproteobacteria bacterium]|nr:hypothetical protein [Deltaproteobacteria bacterium]